MWIMQSMLHCNGVLDKLHSLEDQYSNFGDQREFKYLNSQFFLSLENLMERSHC